MKKLFGLISIPPETTPLTQSAAFDPKNWCQWCARSLVDRRPIPLVGLAAEGMCRDCFNKPSHGERASDRAWEINR